MHPAEEAGNVGQKWKILESPDKGTPQRSLGDSNGAPKMFLQSDLSQLV